MPYRDSIEALSERHETLSRELAASRDHTKNLERMRATETQIAAELSEVSSKLAEMRQTKRSLPLLENVAIASPCTADWNKMTGDDRVRFCGDCKKNVYNLSEMLAAEAEELLRSRSAGKVCVRLYRRTDGTVLTQDCEVGVKKKRRRRIAFGIAGAGALSAAAAASAFAYISKKQAQIETPIMMGEMAISTDGEHAIGAVAPPIPIPTSNTTPTATPKTTSASTTPSTTAAEGSRGFALGVTTVPVNAR